ncbi:hypothetical protein F7725_011465 [Dissostichus mawsoni]|uniref:Uncharacterized protein n=1 Tax=Dissostichus mawsoni TaxID=36200 RepID=A0A7J5Z8X5_DISMA|nr:hypothetical protein F7725_011465 [Dissostichus mawsoni]
MTCKLHNPLKDLLKLYNCQTNLIKRSHDSVSERHGWGNRQHPGFFPPTLEHCYREAQPGGVQHGVPGGAADSAPHRPPHHFGRVLPLLLLSPCQRLLLQGRHGNRKVRNEEEKELE